MRADARRNAEKLRAAAAEVFREQGLDAPLKEIARRAGVSHGTLYNLFGTREALIDEVAVGFAGGRLEEAAEQALAHEDAWAGFVFYLETVCELQATEPAVGDVMSGRFPGAARLMAVCAHTQDTAARIIARAQEAGSLRSDFTREDLLFLFGSNALVARASRGTAPDAWRRGLALSLDGLRAEAAHPLPVSALSEEQHRVVLGRLVGAV
ncbi:TetR/AcrR family transcriptional regulator [Streptomyces roseirectus]|uniref:TetR/AcrR family transcriptional regulator n=1 Tax=Streptomyces roseirectus TaxID=2768066 RepID=A0A7H0I7F8_9ACTN|nr:TetR/AcrR family transcriptional regulator [Streptomyces roseirectus]QNP68724.1 TetR/AcrR family transcriptional regulator [Streptomyces roseirectus]